MFEALVHLFVSGVCALFSTRKVKRPNTYVPRAKGLHVPCKHCNTETTNETWLCDRCSGNYVPPEIIEQPEPEVTVIVTDFYDYG